MGSFKDYKDHVVGFYKELLGGLCMLGSLVSLFMAAMVPAWAFQHAYENGAPAYYVWGVLGCLFFVVLSPTLAYVVDRMMY